ncbi:Arginyl-tRNA--protein transferase 1 [Coemansia sp. RSA 1933]|nr:Arginyl-tRNA--protein transferase 1 [Coemansia sp. RSA 1933]
MTAAPSKLGEQAPAEIDSGIEHEEHDIDDSGSECSSSVSNSSDNSSDNGSDSDSVDDELPTLFNRSQAQQSCIRLYGILQRSRCGYCKAFGGSSYLAARASRLTCDDYQTLIDRGWRRSGTFLYLTDHKDSCCPYYTIRTHALDVSLSSSDKKLLRKWRKHKQRPHTSPDHRNATSTDDLVDKVVECSAGVAELRLDPASFSEEKFRLFEKYQREIHDDLNSTRHGFKEFLCTSPLVPQKIPAVDMAQTGTLEQGILANGHLGSYHQCYYIDGKLAAVGVIDILPKCVSSVYLFYDPDLSHLSLGSFSSLVEIALVRQLSRSVDPGIQYYYMGYYIPTCPKMTYKARWRPADLLDLITLRWIPIERCLERIREHTAFATFDPEIDGLGLVRNCSKDRLPFSPVLSRQAIQCAPDWDSADTERLRKIMDTIKLWARSPAPGHMNVSIPISLSLTRLMYINPSLSSLAYAIAAGLGERLATRAILHI